MTVAGGGGGAKSRVLAAAAVALVLGTAAFYAVSSFARGWGEEAGTGESADLQAWNLIGCYDLRVDPWVDHAPRTDAGSRSGADEERLSGTGAEAEAPVGASFDPPGRLMLLPDSVDLWGRPLPTHRAATLSSDDRPVRSLRWMVRADTLWILWSEGGTRAGVALSRAGDSLVGSARALGAGDTVDLVARASARPINCHTGRGEPLGGGRGTAGGRRAR